MPQNISDGELFHQLFPHYYATNDPDKIFGELMGILWLEAASTQYCCKCGNCEICQVLKNE